MAEAHPLDRFIKAFTQRYVLENQAGYTTEILSFEGSLVVPRLKALLIVQNSNAHEW